MMTIRSASFARKLIQLTTIFKVIGFLPCKFFNSVSIIYFFVKQKPEEGSISHRVQRLAKYRFLKVFGHTDNFFGW